MDSLNDVLFAAGEDGVIRGWSTRSGVQTFSYQLPGDVLSMQVIHEREGVCLWAGSGRNMYRMYVGHK